MTVMKHVHKFALALIIAALIIFTFARCVLPQDAEAANAATEKYSEAANAATEKYRAGEIDLEGFKAAVAAAREELKRDMAIIRDDIVERTKGLGGAIGGTDPLALGLTAIGSVLSSILGTNFMRNRTRRAEIERLERSIAETDAWVEEVEKSEKPAPKA